MAQETVTIFLNTTAQTGGIKATVDGLNRVKESTSALSSKLGDLGSMFLRQILPAVSALTFIRFVNWSITNADAMAKLAQKTGETVQSISALAYAGKLANVTIEQLTVGAKGLSAWLDKTNQSRKSLTDALLEQADIFAKMPDSLEKTRLAQERFGKSGMDLIPLLNQGSAAIRQQIEEAERFGVVIGPKFARDAETFQDNLTRIASIFRGMANLLAGALLPEFIRLQERFIEWVKDTDAHMKVVIGLVEVYKGFARAIAFVDTAFRLLGGTQAAFLGNLSVTHDWKEAWKAATDSVNSDLDKFLARMNELLKLGAEGSKITVKKGTGGTNAFTEMFAAIGEGIDELSREFDNLGASVGNVLVKGIGSAIRTVSDGIWQVIDGTATWGELFVQVGRQVISGLIQIAIQELILDNLKKGIMWAWKGFQTTMRAADVAESNATELAKTPALATNATLSSISSWGIAVAVGVAAIAAILASVGAFQEGGVVAGGEQFIRVNEAGQEAVLNARATAMLGTGMIDALNSGGAGSAEMAQASGGGGIGGANVTVILVDNEQAMLSALESATGQAKIVRIVRSNKTEIGIS